MPGNSSVSVVRASNPAVIPFCITGNPKSLQVGLLVIHQKMDFDYLHETKHQKKQIICCK